MSLVLATLYIFFFSFMPITLSVAANTNGLAYYIDCGSPTNTTDRFNTTWIADRFFTGGSVSVVSEPLHFHNPQEKTLRYFPISNGKKNCYIIPAIPSTRYLIRTFIVYDNYDGKDHPPSFDVSVEGTLVFSWRSPWQEALERDGAYSDLFVFVKDNEADVCFYSIATDPPVIGSIELVQVDPLAYDSNRIGDGYLLVNYGRLSCGSDEWGPGFSSDPDLFGRSWQSDVPFRSNEGLTPATSIAKSAAAIRTLNTKERIKGADVKPNNFPMKLYQSAVTTGGNGVLEYQLPVDAKLDYLILLHFAEIDSTVTKAGQRVFDVVINEKNVTRIDIFKTVGSFAAFSWSYTVQNLSASMLSVKLVTAVGAPLISGLENYALVPHDLATIPEQVNAMRALKESLRVPDRMGWNGDPCAPNTWDAWEGVTCHMDKNGTALMITQIDLGSQGLKGFISDQISLLSNLVTLNLSSNSLEGTIPAGLGQKSLLRLDLSNNQLSGSIPESLASSNLHLVLLNGNLLEGQVPEQLYSIGVHGGTIDLYGNKGLCGVPSLPQCAVFWKHGRLSKLGKIAIGLSCLIVFCLLLLVACIIYIRRRRNDYGFGLPHELMALSAKRNRYQRQKSLMLLEMESLHAKGLPSPFAAR